jgi:hypothetical protein
MRARVSAASLRKLDKVESLLFDDDGRSRGGVLLVPAIMTLDAWEAMAVPMQQRLAESAREDIDREGAVSINEVIAEQRDPSDVTRFYKANPLLEQSHKAHLMR